MPGTARRTLGIDLASQPKNTAACEIEWEDGRGRVVSLEHGNLSDEILLAKMLQPGVSKIAIDAPFGWPQPFLQAITGYSRTGEWPIRPDDRTQRAKLYLRETDREVRRVTSAPDEEGGPPLRAKQPLSVSTDKISIPAMRCAGILAEFSRRTGGPVDRSGGNRVVEVYPDASLRQWHLLPREWDVAGVGYKGNEAAALERRAELAARITAALEDRLPLAEHEAACAASDDVLDALVCALVARAAGTGLTIPVPEKLADVARAEGWIHLPERGSLGRLG